MFCPDFVGLYGLDCLEESLEALKYLTVYSSSEFAVREFLIRDRKRTLAAMERWSTDENHHVRRLSSEGSRPRLPHLCDQRRGAEPSVVVCFLGTTSSDCRGQLGC